jgi:hypothetical protein
MHKTNARFYKIKDEKWNVINDIDPKKFAAAKAAREERARLKAEKEAADRQAALKKLAEDEERARVKSVMDKIARERDAAERARLEAIQRALQAQRESQQRQAALNAANSARVAAVNRQANIWRTIFRPPPPPPRRPPPRRRGRWW